MAETHPMILTSAEAIDYLRLADVTDNRQSAERLLLRLVNKGEIHPLRWSKAYLYGKPDLDAFVAREIARLEVARTDDTGAPMDLRAA